MEIEVYGRTANTIVRNGSIRSLSSPEISVSLQCIKEMHPFLNELSTLYITISWYYLHPLLLMKEELLVSCRIGQLIQPHYLYIHIKMDIRCWIEYVCEKEKEHQCHGGNMDRNTHNCLERDQSYRSLPHPMQRMFR